LRSLAHPKTKDAKESITVNTTPAASVPTNEDKAIPKYDHIFVIIEENKSYDQIIGNSSAPIINQLAKTYGLAANFYAEVHPSEANYIAMLGGDTFGIHDDRNLPNKVVAFDQLANDLQSGKVPIRTDYVFPSLST
jgi:phospholipase C